MWPRTPPGRTQFKHRLGVCAKLRAFCGPSHRRRRRAVVRRSSCGCVCRRRCDMRSPVHHPRWAGRSPWMCLSQRGGGTRVGARQLGCPCSRPALAHRAHGASRARGGVSCCLSFGGWLLRQAGLASPSCCPARRCACCERLRPGGRLRSFLCPPFSPSSRHASIASRQHEIVRKQLVSRRTFIRPHHAAFCLCAR